MRRGRPSARRQGELMIPVWALVVVGVGAARGGRFYWGLAWCGDEPRTNFDTRVRQSGNIWDLQIVISHEQATAARIESERKKQEEVDEENCGNSDSGGGCDRHICDGVYGQERGGDIARGRHERNRESRACGVRQRRAQGIWVSGEGTISVAPDIATLDFGVETNAATVSEANNLASTAMDAIVEALKARGREGRGHADEPLQRLSALQLCGGRSGRRAEQQRGSDGLQGQHRATVKLRDLDAIGEVIDDVVTAGGDVVRIKQYQIHVGRPEA